MGNASSNKQSARGQGLPPVREDEESTVSGERPAMRNDAYEGLMSLGSEAFSAPLPPAPSEPPPLSARVRTGFYVLSGAVGFALAAFGLAIAFKSMAAHKPAPSVALAALAPAT